MRLCNSTTLRETARFDAKNPLAQDAARQNAARMVTEISRETKKAIAQVIQRSIAEGIPPVQQARLIRPMIGLHSRQANAVMNARAQWLKSGLSLTDTEKKVAKYAEKLLKQRSMAIARTESMRASNLGQRTAWRQAEEKGLIDAATTRRVWIATLGSCPICNGLDGEEAAMEGRFSDGSEEPPAHPHCRCTTGLVFSTKSKKQRVAA